MFLGLRWFAFESGFIGWLFSFLCILRRHFHLVKNDIVCENDRELVRVDIC